MNTVKIPNRAKNKKYRLGDIFLITDAGGKEIPCIISRVLPFRYAAISLLDGNRWNEATECEYNHETGFSEKDIKEMFLGCEIEHLGSCEIVLNPKV